MQLKNSCSTTTHLLRFRNKRDVILTQRESLRVAKLTNSYKKKDAESENMQYSQCSMPITHKPTLNYPIGFSWKLLIKFLNTHFNLEVNS